MRKSYCLYCGDTKVRDDWDLFGGTIGETHYVCHRKRCQAKRQRVLEARRKQAEERKAARAARGG